MKINWIVELLALLLGCAWAGLVGLLLKLTRSDRALNHRLVIRMCQFFALSSMVGGLVLLQLLDEHAGVKRHTDAFYAATFAYVFGALGTLVFILRVDYRWQKSAGLAGKTSNRKF